MAEQAFPFPRIGRLESGPRNLITDVPGVLVGHCTLDAGPVQTGVTAVLPHGDNCFQQKVPAACHIINGFGKSLGLVQVEELGQLETPILLTNTLSVGTVWTALARHMLVQNPAIGRETGTVNPVVMECNDGYLNDIRGMHVQEAHAQAALAAASGDFDQGAAGAGRGMRCHGLKGGIGSASRVMEIEGASYTLGALVLSNHGQLSDLTIAGQPVGGGLAATLQANPPDKGSVIVVLATDLPLSAAQLKRLCRRAEAGLSRTGANMGHGSGEIVLAFSTARRVLHDDVNAFRSLQELNEKHIDLAFRAVAESVEEAVLRSLYHAQSVTGRDGHRAMGLLEALALGG